MAGVTLTALLVSVGIGYAEAAGLPAIYGLYATIIPLLAYALFGPSRILIVGPDSAVTVLVGATILPLSRGDVSHAVTLASLLAVISGTICIMVGLARFGFVTDLLSKPLRHGYLNGIALTLMIGQFPKLLGFSVSGNDFFGLAEQLAHGILEGRVNWVSCAIGISCLATIQIIRRCAPRFPAVLLSVILATLAVVVFDLARQANVAVVGTLPQGLPALRIPTATVTEFASLCVGALAIALVSIADMSVLSRSYAMRGGYYVDENQEMIALGISNVASGLFQGFSVSGSVSRTPVAEVVGARSRMAGVMGALCIALLLVFAPRLMQSLPAAALGAVVISACVSIFQFSRVRRLYKLRRGEFYLSMICFLGVVSIGVIQGLFIAVGMALLMFIWRAWRPYCAVLGRVYGVRGYHDITRHPEARLIPGLVLFRWDAPLFFANAEMFREQMLRAVSTAPTPTRWIVVAAEPVTDVDITAADVLAELEVELKQAGIELYFAEMKGPVKDHLKRYGLFARLGTENFFSTLGQAVDSYVDRYRIDRGNI